MKAVVYDAYGPPDGMRVVEMEKPAPKEDEVLVRVHAVSVNGADWEALVGSPLYARMGGLRRPPKNKILGSDIAGIVEAVGSAARDFRPGDEVYGETLRYADGFAEYVCVREKGLARKPPELSFAQASAIPQAGVIALQALRNKAKIQPGQQVLINGAGGSAGMFAIQLAKLYGAEVTGVDNAGKLDFMRSLGADHGIDYTRQDYTRTGTKYDFILDPIARRSPFAVQRALKPTGSYYVVGGLVRYMLQVLAFGPIIRRTTGKNIRVLAVHPNRVDMEAVAAMVKAGQIRVVIDRVYPLGQLPEALRCVGEGRALGKVVIKVAG